MPKMTDAELKALLSAECNASLGGTLTSDLSSDRAKAMDYYNGDMSEDMPSATGRSSAVSTDVADTIEGLMPSLMEIFAAGEEVIRFDPVGPEDEEAAKQETDYVNHVFMQKNPGFMVLYTFIKDALLSKNSFVKVYWDETEREERETYLEQPDDVFAMMASQPDVEVIEHTENRQDDGSVLHDVTLVKRKNYGCCKFEPVPPEEFGISKNARTIKDTTYCFHQVRKTQADLIKQGYDEDQIKALPTAGSTDTKEEDQARNVLNEDQAASDSVNKAARLIDTIEHYVLMDYEGDDKPGLWRVTTGGTQLEVLKRNGESDVVRQDVIPFASMTPIIMTHRFYGKSVADLVMDIQKIKTALTRGYLDNIYLLNNQRVEVAETMSHERTLDDLLVNRPGSIVRTKMPGAVNPIPNQPIGDTILPAFQYFDATREWRTGVTRQGQGIDANALQNETATKANQVFTAAQARMKLIARIFAETGVRDMFLLGHGCIRKNDKRASVVKLRNKWVRVDPRVWKTRDDMTPNVGLGTGSKEAQIAHLMTVLGIQKEMMLAQLPTCTPKNVYNTAAKLVEKVDLKTPEPYFTDPESEQGQQLMQQAAQKPDPEMAKIQADKEKIAIQAQLDQKADERKAQIEQVQAQADIATNQQKIQAEAQIKQMEFELKKQLAILEFQLEERKFEREQARQDREHQQNMALREREHSAAMEQGAFSMQASREKHEQTMAQSKAKGNGK